jgi:16S rRNA (guanine966-N2)-methyltransferase
MRISGGEFRGRILTAPKGQDVRPASDKVRQAVFNSLLSRIDLRGANILDGFCGTGSYGLEALSRGAKFCTFIDKDVSFCRKNVTALDVENQSKILQKDLLKLSEKPEEIPAANLLFLDPPYRKSLLLPSLEILQDKGWLADSALCVLECEKEFSLNKGEEKVYGDVKITYVELD